jgi:inosine-uridine nucleoside N-ribohydrolase
MRHFILGTDWGEDCDDAVAVRYLARKHRAGEIELCGIGLNTRFQESVPSLTAFLANEGVAVPIGIDRDCPELRGRITYQKRLAAYRSDVTNADAEDAVRLYRRLLAEAEEPVEIMEVGFLQVIAAALTSEADDLSSLSGVELFREKVAHVWIMGGRWDVDGGKEYNFSRDAMACRAAATLVEMCPVPIIFLGWEIGATVITGSKLPEGDMLRDVLTDHGSGKGRMSWDPMLVHLATSPDPAAAGYTTVCGSATVDPETGVNHFTTGQGMHRYVVKAREDAFYAGEIDNVIG